ncbi:MAG: tetratricopeptide repeat protein, partial [Bacteroidota bacterium]
MRLYFLLLLLPAGLFAQEECYVNRDHPMPVLSDTTKKNNESKLTLAEADYRKDSGHADAIIWLGRREAYLGHYNKAIDIFSRGIALHPADASMYRHRGHRYITLRCFDKAIADFTKAAQLVKGKPDE